MYRSMSSPGGSRLIAEIGLADRFGLSVLGLSEEAAFAEVILPELFSIGQNYEKNRGLYPCYF
jgi:hypothetical protein